MCGRYVSPSGEEIGNYWKASNRIKVPFLTRYNVAPTQSLPVIRGADRELVMMKWGLIPVWARDQKMGAKLNNARGETVASKPSFRSAFKRRRCLVPMAGFYEWKATPAGKVPHYFTLLNEPQLAAAGIWEHWKAPDDQVIESFSIITTEANAIMAPVHDRMPVILPPDAIEGWLDPDNTDIEDLELLLVPYPAEEMQQWTVSTRVNNARNQGAELIEPSK